MVFKRSSRDNEPVPRRRQSLDDDGNPREVPRTAPTPIETRSSQFRRNQTLSSYRRTEQSDESSRHKAHQLVSQRRRLSGMFLIVASISIALLLLLWQFIAGVHITKSSEPLVSSFDASVYEQQVNDYLSLHPAERLRFALDEEALSEYLSQQSPEVAAIKINGSAGVAQADATISFRTPVAGWQIGDTQYYVDKNGVVFDTNYFSAPEVQIVDESGVSPGQGGAVVGTRLLAFLGKVVAEAGEKGYSVSKAVLPEGTARQVDVYFDGVSTRIKLSIDRGAGEQLEDAKRSLDYLKSRGVKPEYIDVRVAGRAAYK